MARPLAVRVAHLRDREVHQRRTSAVDPGSSIDVASVVEAPIPARGLEVVVREAAVGILTPRVVRLSRVSVPVRDRHVLYGKPDLAPAADRSTRVRANDVG